MTGWMGKVRGGRERRGMTGGRDGAGWKSKFNLVKSCELPNEMLIEEKDCVFYTRKRFFQKIQEALDTKVRSLVEWEKVDTLK